jgi:hypothetical protein
MPLHPAAAALKARHTRATQQLPGVCQVEAKHTMCCKMPAGRTNRPKGACGTIAVAKALFTGSQLM